MIYHRDLKQRFDVSGLTDSTPPNAVVLRSQGDHDWAYVFEFARFQRMSCFGGIHLSRTVCFSLYSIIVLLRNLFRHFFSLLVSPPMKF